MSSSDIFCPRAARLRIVRTHLKLAVQNRPVLSRGQELMPPVGCRSGSCGFESRRARCRKSKPNAHLRTCRRSRGSRPSKDWLMCTGHTCCVRGAPSRSFFSKVRLCHQHSHHSPLQLRRFLRLPVRRSRGATSTGCSGTDEELCRHSHPRLLLSQGKRSRRYVQASAATSSTWVSTLRPRGQPLANLKAKCFLAEDDFLSHNITLLANEKPRG